MRDVNSLKGLHGLRTMHSAKKRCMPRVRSSAYLDVYMLSKEKERLLKESERLALRNTIIKKRLEEIDLEVSRLQEAEASVKVSTSSSFSKRACTQKNGVKKEWKKMALNY